MLKIQFVKPASHLPAQTAQQTHISTKASSPPADSTEETAIHATALTGLVWTLVSFIIALSIACVQYAFISSLFDALIVLSMTFLPLRILLWLAVRH